MHKRVIVLILSVYLSLSDFGVYWELTADLGKNLLSNHFVTLQSREQIISF